MRAVTSSRCRRREAPPASLESAHRLRVALSQLRLVPSTLRLAPASLQPLMRKQEGGR